MTGEIAVRAGLDVVLPALVHVTAERVAAGRRAPAGERRVVHRRARLQELAAGGMMLRFQHHAASSGCTVVDFPGVVSRRPGSRQAGTLAEVTADAKRRVQPSLGA